MICSFWCIKKGDTKGYSACNEVMRSWLEQVCILHSLSSWIDSSCSISDPTPYCVLASPAVIGKLSQLKLSLCEKLEMLKLLDSEIIELSYP